MEGKRSNMHGVRMMIEGFISPAKEKMVREGGKRETEGKGRGKTGGKGREGVDRVRGGGA